MIIDLPKLGPVKFRDDLTEREFQAQLQRLATKYDFKLPKPEVGIPTLIGRAAMRGIGETGIALGDVLPAMAGSALGFEDYAKRQMEEAQASREALEAKYPTQFKSYTEVGSPYEALQYGAETLGELLPTAATSMIPGVGFGAVGSRVAGTAALRAAQAAGPVSRAGLAGVEQAAKVGARRGMYGGVYLGSLVQNAPEVFEGIYRETDRFEPGVAALAGGISAVLDSIVPANVLGQLGGYGKLRLIEEVAKKTGAAPKVWKTIGLEAAKSAGAEGLTESTQELISAAAQQIAGSTKELFGPENIQNFKEAFVKGAIGGGAFGAVGGGAEFARAGSERKAAYEDALARRAQMQRARQIAKSDAAIQEFAAQQPQMQLPGFELGPVTDFGPLTEFGPDRALKGAKVPKTPKAPEQLSLFDEQGEPTEVALKAKERTEKKAAQMAALQERLAKAQTREEEAQLKAAIAELTNVPTNLAELATGPSSLQQLINRVQTELNALAAKRAPAAPAVEPTAPVAEAAAPAVEPTAPEAAAPVVEEPAARTPESFAAEIASGKQLTSPEDVQYYQNNAAAIEEELKRLQAAGQPAGPISTEVVQETPEVATVAEAPAPDLFPTKIGATKDELKAFGKLFGIGPTARILREDGPLAGKDLSNPADAAEVRRVLEAYASAKPAAGAAAKIEEYLKRPEFQGAPDATGIVEPAGGESTGVVDESVTGPSTEGAGVSEPSGVVSTTEATGEPVGGATVEPAALEPTTETEAPVTEAKGKKAKTDERKAEAGTKKALEEQANFIKEVDDNVNRLLVGRLREAGHDIGLSDKDLPAGDYRGSRVHNMLRLAPLISQYNDTRELLQKEEKDSPQAKKNQQQLDQIVEAIALSGKGALEFFQNLKKLPPWKQTPYLSELNKKALRQFYGYARANVAKIKEQIEAEQRTPEAPSTAGKAAPAKKAAPTLDELVDQFHARYQELSGKRLFLPKYVGATFNDEARALAEKGDFNGLLRNAIERIANPIVKQIMRRVLSLNLKTKLVVGSVEDAQSGSYDPATDTITLDPTNGLNDHTLIHEALHAALSHVFANLNHPLTKQFIGFFEQIKNRLGDAYGGQDLQEFAAEFVGNFEFQALLKTIKAPRSGNMFMRMVQAVAEFFGFRGKTAFDQAAKFINDAIDISGDVEPGAATKMFLGMGNFAAVGQIGKAMPQLAGKTVEDTKNLLSNLRGGDLLKAAFGMLRLDNLNTLYGKELPAIQKLINAIEKRAGAQEKRIKDANTKYASFLEAQKKHPQAVERMNQMGIDARLAEVDILDPNFKPSASNQAEYSRLKQVFRSLPPDVQKVYETMRKDYDTAFKSYIAMLQSAVSPSLAQKLQMQFQKMVPVTGYVPFLRNGDYWIEYADPVTGERVASAFESVRERDQFVSTMLTPNKIAFKAYKNLNDIRFVSDGVPPTSFVGSIMADLKKQGATQQQLDSVYQTYLTLFPAESIVKQFMKSKNVLGMEKDLIRGYGQTMVKWSRKLANSEYSPEIDRAITEIANQAKQANKPDTTAAAQNILDQASFIHNPTYSNFVQAATTLSYFEYIAGNISSALVNLTALPMLTWPTLGGKFGFDKAFLAMSNASKVMINGIEKDARYKKLYDTLMDHAQLEHTTAREILEGRRESTKDYVGLKGKMMGLLAAPFSATERYNRGTTAVAAFDLARSNGMSEADAIQFALTTVKDMNTSGLSATAPKWMQHPIGRVFFTFKSFTWNTAFIIARAFHQAVKGEKADVRRAAHRQLLGIYGMATVFAGAKGMPFYGAVSTLATMLNALFGDDDEPFDFDEEMREFLGEVFYKGFVNSTFNLEISNRVGLATDLLFRDDPRGVAEHGYVLSAMQQAFGPAGSYAVNVGNAVKMMNEGHVERAIEAVMPSFARNFMKGARYMTEGAQTLKGDPVIEDVSAYNSLMQAIGFAPADLSSVYERVSAAKGFEREVTQRRVRLLNRYDMAVTAGDTDMLFDTQEAIQEFNSKFPEKRITGTTLAKSQRARRQAEQQMIHGVKFDKKLRPRIEEEFFG